MTHASPVTTKITRIGNSKGIILPMQVMRSLALTEGDTVAIRYEATQQQLIITFPSTRQLTLNPSLHN